MQGEHGYIPRVAKTGKLYISNLVHKYVLRKSMTTNKWQRYTLVSYSQKKLHLCVKDDQFVIHSAKNLQ